MFWFPISDNKHAGQKNLERPRIIIMLSLQIVNTYFYRFFRENLRIGKGTSTYMEAGKYVYRQKMPLICDVGMNCRERDRNAVIRRIIQ
jgi:hypothetical protein